MVTLEIIVIVALIGYWFAFKRDLIQPDPALFAQGAALLVCLNCLHAGLIITRILRRDDPVARGLVRFLVLLGSICIFGGGLFNWLRSLQGYLVLLEGDTVQLSQPNTLQERVCGLLARPEELAVSVRLEKLELIRQGGGDYFPLSRLFILDQARQSYRAELFPGHVLSVGPLRLHQGAFGFAPRIILLRGAETLLDQVVPFTTSSSRNDGLLFGGTVAVSQSEINIQGSLNFSGLDDRLRGHARLELSVTRGNELLGSGELLPGHFADIGAGFRVGFAGLSRWSEIDVARQNYRLIVVIGCALLLFGLVGSSFQWGRKI